MIPDLTCLGTSSLQRVLVTDRERQRVLEACHSGVDGGHFGRDKTLSKVGYDNMIVL
jgi:hypothetical protein